MARKFGTQKRNVGGFEAPRNSLELPSGAYPSYYTPQGDQLYKCQETYDWCEQGCNYPTEAPMKKLISDEMSKRSKSNGPSIVARLMGVDTMPLDTNPVLNDSSKDKLTRSTSVGSKLSPSKSFRHTSLDSLHLSEDSDLDEITKKPMPRQHPQEEELQKFKKEFEAWQSARFKECSKIVEHNTISDQWIAQENLNREKMNLYAYSSTKIKLEDLKRSHSVNENRPFLVNHDATSAYPEPSKIVILRPGFDNNSTPEEPFASSSGASEDRTNIEDFLEEVKQRLKNELHGKTFKTGLVRGGGIETPFSERPSDPKQIAQRIAKQVRESVTKDLGSNLLRSESTRSYRGEFQCSGTNSPEFISRDTRRLLSKRLRNVLKKEESPNNDINLKHENDIQSKSFRCGNDDIIIQKDLSPVNLVRSLSAPVSGTSFGKLLLEDRHVATGAHIRRKHEGIEKLTIKVKKQRKDKFNLKEKVSSLKYNLTLRARLFGRKIHSASEFRDNDFHDRSFVKDIMNRSTLMMNIADRPENGTEVPPSPASICSSIHDDYYRAAYCASPTTTPGGPTSDDSDLPQAFRDISSNLHELRKQLHQLETGRSDETVIEEQPPYESEMADLEDEDESYIRELLIASGLYDNSFEKRLSRWDTYAKPISNRIFDQVEESYKNNISNEPNPKSIDHKVLLDLVNEVLSTLLAPPMHVSKFSKKAKLARGNKLLDQVWGMIRAYLHPLVDKSFYFFDTMVARDLESMAWSEMVFEDIGALAKEMEGQIMRDLVEEMVNDMRDNVKTVN
ncbi:uncharacterized protein LOC143606351 [Bidens hawaiensis]|uniref:uncharacterized protein LOC143606351 n=1 Tax=Bidens hawaiensis TaxID=980011 RepID=UPI0040499B3F